MVSTKADGEQEVRQTGKVLAQGDRGSFLSASILPDTTDRSTVTNMPLIYIERRSRQINYQVSGGCDLNRVVVAWRGPSFGGQVESSDRIVI